MTLPVLTGTLSPADSGGWGNDAHAQQGILVHVGPARGFAFWYVFDEAGNQRHFHFAFDPASPEGALWETAGGTLLDDSDTERRWTRDDDQVWPNAQLYRTADGLRFVYDTKEFGREAIDLKPVRLGEVSTWAVDPVDGKQGFTLLESPGHAALYWFTNRPDGQRWLQMTGAWDGLSGRLSIREILDGNLFMYKPLPMQDRGGAVLNRTGADMQLEIDIPGEAVVVMLLRRVA
jgi:hypothetical protein